MNNVALSFRVWLKRLIYLDSEHLIKNTQYVKELVGFAWLIDRWILHTLITFSVLLIYCSSFHQDIPTPFWRSHGEDKFDKKVYTLEGPWTKGDVKAYVCRTWRQTKCLFIGGWQAFCVANKLKIGDTVVFNLTGQYQFVVSVEA